MSFNFNNLSLAGVDISSGGNRLKPGRYICTVTGVEQKNTRTGGGVGLSVSLADVAGPGSIDVWLNLMIPTSEEATRIGREQLKALLVHGGHPDPDNIGRHGLGSIKGLKVGVLVEMEKYMKDGVWKDGSRVTGFVAPSAIDPSLKGASNGAAKKSAFPDDTIPF